MAGRRSTLVVACLVTLAHANNLDTVMPQYVNTCPSSTGGCAQWTKVGASAAQWASATAEASAANHCAMPALANRGANYQPWCYCNGTTTIAKCTAPLSVPEQINLQLAASNVVVVSFVTFENKPPTSPPVAMFGESSASMEPLKGVFHSFTTFHSGQPARNYTLNFIRFLDLKPQQSYSYKVKSGADAAQWSDVFHFRAPYDHKSGVTRIGIYGDMGNSQFNNMANLGADCSSGAIDAIFHMGDHAYDMGSTDGFRGDSYMNAFSQAAIASCPWFPIIGNHESTMCPGDEEDLATQERYLNQTWGEAFGQLNSTATSGLGHLLTKGSLLGAGVHGSNPSGTSQWLSVDIGLIHLVGLDLDPGHSPGPPVFSGVQEAWLDKDLAAANANRANVPWIIVTSHFPLYNAKFEGNDQASSDFYFGDVAEAFATCGHEFVSCNSNNELKNCSTLGDYLRVSRSALEPYLAKYAVDVYDAGHVHSYDTTWPMCDGSICNGTKSYVNPKGPVHITEGNGGVPGVKGANSLKNCTSSYGRHCGTGGAYGRFTAWNASVLSYEHVENPTGKVTDSWDIVKSTRLQPSSLYV